jgi:hypothetical protein
MKTKRPERTLRRHSVDPVDRSAPPTTTTTESPTSSPEAPQSVEVESQRVFRVARSEETHLHGLRQATLRDRNKNRWA